MCLWLVLHAFVEYETVEAAEKAVDLCLDQVATLNDEQDWRNGMRVKLLKRMLTGANLREIMGREGKPGGDLILRRTTVVELLIQLAMRSIKTRMIVMMIHLMKRQEGEHLSNSKEKNDGQKGRNRGRSRRQRYRGGPNGLGHGTTSSHALEPTKPPPGPRMPDGTRGFSMGRGRPPISNQS
ncbi:hypothetical protein CISIN_1g042134mg [Citrus sinensis]|uniref:Uncharacterized protein n=1 Tax=Citrus sinensis TaxID=2711 RepID=A0A067GEW6_CITSI|nr:hypothetical protein CISIN_1g042134mg [Citrus sinensis]